MQKQVAFVHWKISQTIGSIIVKNIMKPLNNRSIRSQQVKYSLHHLKHLSLQCTCSGTLITLYITISTIFRQQGQLIFNPLLLLLLYLFELNHYFCNNIIRHKKLLNLLHNPIISMVGVFLIFFNIHINLLVSLI